MENSKDQKHAPALKSLREWLQKQTFNEQLVQLLIEMLKSPHFSGDSDNSQNYDKSLFELLLNLSPNEFDVNPVVRERIERQAWGELLPEIPLLFGWIESAQCLRETGCFLESSFELLGDKQDQHSASQAAHFERDLRGVECPRNYVKASVILKRLPQGALLTLSLDPGMPIENVPMRLIADGYEVQSRLKVEDHWQIKVYKP